VVGLGRCVGGVVGVYKAPGPIRPFRARAGRRAAAVGGVAGAGRRYYGLIDQVMNCSKNCRSQELQRKKEVIVLLFDYVHSSARSMLS
jgi:hypothetical protein